MSKQLGILLFLFSFIVLNGSPAIAGELRILDNVGLARAVKNVSGAATVKIRVKYSDEVHKVVKLVHVDGLANDITPASETTDAFIFQGVPVGTWRISDESAKVSVVEVKIVQ